MKINKKPGDPIHVVWIDACSKSGWILPKEVSEDGTENCFTRGWLVKETANNIFVTATKGRTTEEYVLGYVQIPKAWIKKVR